VSTKTIAREFVEMCSQGKNFDVMRTLYAPSIVSVERDGTETAGQASVIRKSEIWQASNPIHGGHVRGPFFHGAGQFAVHFTVEVTPKATGQPTTLEEVGLYTVENDKITREQFFNDGDGWPAVVEPGSAERR